MNNSLYEFRNRFLKNSIIGCGSFNHLDLMALQTYEMRCFFSNNENISIILNFTKKLDNGDEKKISNEIRGFEIIKIEDFNIEKVAISQQEAFNGIDAPASCYIAIDIDCIKKISEKDDVILKYYWYCNPTCAGGDFLLVRKINGHNEVIAKFRYMRA